MKKIIILLSGIFATTFFFSCRKESDKPSTTDITGTWTFVSIDATTNAIAEATQGSENR
jgi:hypothetical protein